MKTSKRRNHIAAALTLSLIVTCTTPVTARADFLSDAKEKGTWLIEKVVELKDNVVSFLEEKGITPAIRQGYDTLVDFIFTYETQPDDEDMENLARSWAVTAWLEDEEKEESNVYYFDNHTLTMVEDLTQIGRGYNLKKNPSGSGLNGKYTGILKAVVKSASMYTVEWVNYDEEISLLLMQKMQEKKNTAETETE